MNSPRHTTRLIKTLALGIAILIAVVNVSSPFNFAANDQVKSESGLGGSATQSIVIPEGPLMTPLIYRGLKNATISATGPIVLTPGSIGPKWRTMATGAAIMLFRCSNVTVILPYVDGGNQPVIPVAFDSTSDCKLQYSTFVNVGRTNAAVCSLSNTNLTIDANTITGTATETRGMWLGNAHTGERETNLVITRNTVTKCGATGIGLLALNPIVECNTSNDNAGAGIAIGGSPPPLMATFGGTFSGNICNRNAFQGIQGDAFTAASQMPIIGCTVRGNVLDDNLHAGLYVAGCQQWTCEDNAAKGNRGGPWVVVASRYCTVNGVQFQEGATYTPPAKSP